VHFLIDAPSRGAQEAMRRLLTLCALLVISIVGAEPVQATIETCSG